MTGPAAFRALHHRTTPFLLPNCWDVASGLLLADDAPALGTTSLGITAAAGLPDGAGAGRDLVVALAATLVPRLRVPLTVDLEGGYSDDPAQVADLAVQLAEIGVAGINLEDGLEGRRLRPAAQHAAVIAAVKAVAPELFLNARTDTWWLRTGPDSDRLHDTTERIAAYRDAGADGIFTPGLTDLAQLEHVATAVALPLNALWQPGVHLDELGAAGVRRISTGSALYRHALGAALSSAASARGGTPPTGTTLGYADLQHRLRPPSPQPGQQPPDDRSTLPWP